MPDKEVRDLWGVIFFGFPNALFRISTRFFSPYLVYIKQSSNAAPLILPVGADIWIQDYLQAKLDEETAAERKRLAENKLKEVIGNHEKAISPGGYQATWKMVQSSRIDSARLKKEQPALFEKFSTTSTTRRFSISEGK